MKNSFLTGTLSVSNADFPIVSTNTDFRDFMGAVMVRWGINRDNYRINPGLYAVGTPGQESDVFVTANYKLSFDALRKSLSGISGWILVLDTKGINVWCAAGKGTFGTKELVNRINLVSLEKVVNHKRLILPQLGATGVAAHKVKEETGFNVHYGPVRANDIKQFINDGYRANTKMRRVTFSFTDRIKLIPNDFMYGKYYLLGAMAVLLIISGLYGKGFSLSNILSEGKFVVLKVFLAYVAGIVITPMFLPYLPGRHFSLKGFFSGVLVFTILAFMKVGSDNLAGIISWFLVLLLYLLFLQ
jgi:hypothetical protein